MCLFQSNSMDNNLTYYEKRPWKGALVLHGGHLSPVPCVCVSEQKPGPTCWASLPVICEHVGLPIVLILIFRTEIHNQKLPVHVWDFSGAHGAVTQHWITTRTKGRSLFILAHHAETSPDKACHRHESRAFLSVYKGINRSIRSLGALLDILLYSWLIYSDWLRPPRILLSRLRLLRNVHARAILAMERSPRGCDVKGLVFPRQ